MRGWIVIIGAVIAFAIGLALYFAFRVPEGVTPMNGETSMTIAWISLAVAVLSLATAVVGLIQKVIELRAAKGG